MAPPSPGNAQPESLWPRGVPLEPGTTLITQARSVTTERAVHDRGLCAARQNTAMIS